MVIDIQPISYLDTNLIGEDNSLSNILQEVISDDLYNKYIDLTKKNFITNLEEQIHMYKGISEDTGKEIYIFEIRFKDLEDSLFLQAKEEQMKILPNLRKGESTYEQ